MTISTLYILQLVGFKTTLAEKDFITRWTPFASNFKSQGIITIDLYKVANNDQLTYISRNIWEEKTYFQNFPSGVAGSGSGGGISVTQFGGYRLQQEYSERKDDMRLIFSNDALKADHENAIVCPSASYKVPFKQVLLYSDAFQPNTNVPSIAIQCDHLKRI